MTEDAHGTGYAPPPGDLIREELKKRGWTQLDLAQVLDQPAPRVNQIIQGKQTISPETAIALSKAFDISAQEWITREFAYRRYLTLQEIERLQGDSKHYQNSPVQKRKKLYELAPVKEMQRRGWIRADTDADATEASLRRYFGIESIDNEPPIHGNMRKSAPSVPASPAQRAWAFRVRQLASAIPAASVGRYDESAIDDCIRDLRKLAAYSAEVRKVPTALKAYGIRFVIVEGLSGAKVDGFATWLDDASPVIGLSLRYDRFDSFWFTLGHELSHIKHRDISPVDSDIGTERDPSLEVKPPMERRADSEASSMFIPDDELKSFILRVGPLYSTEKINQFANRIKMHPSIIIGQLKYRGEIGYSAHNKSAVQVRDTLIKHAITDGWDRTINPGALP
ncbi:HTH-type transcriptional regulator / antitoxin HigA [Singulisphaera sp. GP187]|uniref:helix-turn-helix domain-containing protein n=1 Tax=Singulisphaera sp. GP187 TaxID=1882752 RepID=UPI00092A7C00|nr:helix-turn-helix domain-containing protein [Singulisphaera sp. GP187]SIN69428.1 HTH-type transcriptional regulator / antitoxin HigA [Singulisphaera sp. GP187]